MVPELVRMVPELVRMVPKFLRMVPEFLRMVLSSHEGLKGSKKIFLGP